MASINDALSPALLFNTLKRLDCIETTIVRRVCKQWFKIIDEHKSFWRTLHLPEDSLKKWDPSILELFDQKSGSTLQDVEVEIEVKEDLLEEFFNILLKSKETLRHFLFTADYIYYGNKADFIGGLVKLECLKVLEKEEPFKVRLRTPGRKSIQRNSLKDELDSASPLKVLWYSQPGRFILKIDGTRFKNLRSLDTRATLSSSEWRMFLEGPSRSLKHLRLGFKNWDYEDHSGVPSLDFPNLEVLEINHGGKYPQWLLIPDTAKFFALSGVSNLPSVSELWTWDLENHSGDIINRLPKLTTLCLMTHAFELEDVLSLLNERKVNVEAGLKVDGVEMEMIKTLVVPYDLCEVNPWSQVRESLERCKEMVQVVEADPESRFIEIDV